MPSAANISGSPCCTSSCSTVTQPPVFSPIQSTMRCVAAFCCACELSIHHRLIALIDVHGDPNRGFVGGGRCIASGRDCAQEPALRPTQQERTAPVNWCLHWRLEFRRPCADLESERHIVGRICKRRLTTVHGSCDR